MQRFFASMIFVGVTVLAGCPKPKPEPPTPTSADWPPAGYKVAEPAPTASGNTTPGWVELPSLSTHRAVEAIAQRPPLLNGSFDEKGGFYPNGTAATRKDCPKEQSMFLELGTVQLSATPPAPTAATRLLFLCEGKETVEGKEGILVIK